MGGTTVEDPALELEEDGPAAPGLVVVFTAGRPTLRALSVDGRLIVGRDDVSGASHDERMSREHAEVTFDGVGWTVRDLGSRNGTFVDGVQARVPLQAGSPRVLRMGGTVCLFARDLRPFVGRGVVASAQMVAGPRLQPALDAIAAAARTGDRLLITGESGVGKELAARAFHGAGPRARGRFMAVNCAAIPAGVAERLLFGAVKGAYSGADAPAEGYLPAADGGVLFLDEIGELGLEVQAKLLRALEHREVMPLGATTPRRADVHVCFATNRDLRAAIAERRFRDDLYYRIAQAQVRLPPLRERAEEIPFHIERELAPGDGPSAPSVRFVEECLRRPWPGNVRELVAALRQAIASARAEGARSMDVKHLDAAAGVPVVGSDVGSPREEVASPAPLSEEDALLREQLLALLVEHHGNVSQVAHAMGKARMQVQRWLARLELDAARYRR